MIKIDLAGTLEKYDIKDNQAGKAAKITFACKVEQEPGLTNMGVDILDFSPSGTTKETTLQNIPVLNEGFNIELWSNDAKEGGALSQFTFDHIVCDKVKVVQVKLNGEDGVCEPVAKIVFSVWASGELNAWLYNNFTQQIFIKFTQCADQKSLFKGAAQ